MARPLRVHYEGAVYHVTSRGNERKNIVRSDKDRELFLWVLAQVVEDHHVMCHAWVLMDNHYHLLVETPEANLSRAIRHLNGVYTQKFNRRNNRVGHLFQGRYKAIHVEKGTHLLELCRYVVLNPVRARLVKHPRKWKWSSYRATAGIEKKEPWFEVDWVLGQFGRQSKQAQRAYRKFVLEGLRKKESPWEKMEGGVYYGGEGLKEKLKGLLDKKDPEIPMKHHRIEKHTAEDVIQKVSKAYKVEEKEITTKFHKANEARDVGMYLLRKRAHLGLKEIAEKFGVKYSAVGNRIAMVKKRMEGETRFKARIDNIK